MTINCRSTFVGRRAVALAVAGLMVATACSSSSEARPPAEPAPTEQSTSTVAATTTTEPIGTTEATAAAATTATAATSRTATSTTSSTTPRSSSTSSTTTPRDFDPSGFDMPTTDLKSLRLVFADDFSAYGDIPLGEFPAATGRRWGGYGPGVSDTTGFGQYDMERTVSVIDGVLDIWPHTDGGIHYVAAPWPILSGTEGNSLRYGRIEFAFRAEPVDGYKTAWLLWPDSGNGRRDGEIDFPEGNLDGIDSISGYMHRQGAKHGGDQDVRSDGVYANNVWHRATIIWLPNLCEFWLDGVQLGTSITKRVPRTPMHWIFQTETALDFSNPPNDAAAGHVQLDWVTIWQYDPAISAP